MSSNMSKVRTQPGDTIDKQSFHRSWSLTMRLRKTVGGGGGEGCLNSTSSLSRIFVASKVIESESKVPRGKHPRTTFDIYDNTRSQSMALLLNFYPTFFDLFDKFRCPRSHSMKMSVESHSRQHLLHF